MHLKCSETNVIIPEGVLAIAEQSALLEEGVMVSIDAHGVDVGTDMSGGLARDQKKLRQKSDVAAKRARRVDVLAWTDRTAAKLGRTAVGPVQSYGSSAVRADDRMIRNKSRTWR